MTFRNQERRCCKMSKEAKENLKKATVKNWAFWLFGLVSLALGIIGFFMPPKGSIDGSVLMFGGLMFAFATLFMVDRAIEKGLDAKVKHGETEVTIGDLNN